MKRILATLLLIATAIAAEAQVQVKESAYTQVRLAFTTPLPQVYETGIEKQTFSAIALEGFAPQTVVGSPALPMLTKLVEVSLGEGLVYDVIRMVCDTVAGSELGITSPIVPAQPSRSKSDVTPHALEMDQALYARNSFCGAAPIELEAIGIARNRNLARVSFSPIRWNPVTNQVIIVKEIEIAIRQQRPDIAATKQMQRLHASPAYNNAPQVINTIGAKDIISTAPIRYTIVSHSSFRGALDDFAAWKRRKGFMVDLVYTDDLQVGNTTSSIQSYLQGLYDNATLSVPAPTYVLFVGDVAQVPAFVLTAYGESHHSDLSYCCWTGEDNIPDCYYGRFSAQTLEQLQPQISKTLMYEQYTFPDDSYLNNAALIAGVDGGYSGDYAYRYADPTMDYIAKTYVRADNGFSSVSFYKNNTDFAPNGVTVTGSSNPSSTATALIALYNSGCGWVNYSAHGSETSWHQPSLTNSSANALTNDNKPMVMIGNCCLTNSFQIDACFGETLLRKGNNAGAVAYIGASNSTYWQEDFYWAVGVRSNISNTCDPDYMPLSLGMYDRQFHTHGEAYSNWYRTMGEMIHSGNMSVESGNSQSSMKLYYWQIYHLMGDPSLMPYHGQAQTLRPNAPGALSVGASSMTVNTVPYAYVALTDNNHNLVGATLASATGDAILHFDALRVPGTYELVITAQDYRPYMQTVNVIDNGPYVSVSDMSATVPLDANSDVSFNVTLHNLGMDMADSVTIEFQTNSGMLLLNTTGPSLATTGLDVDSEVTLTGVCDGHIWGNITDQSVCSIQAIVRWGRTVNDRSANTWNFTLNADETNYESHTFDNTLDSLDYATLTITNRNNGNATMANGTISLLCLDPTLQIEQESSTVNNLQPGQTVTTDYVLTLNGPMPQNRAIPFIQTINNGFRTTYDTVKIVFGQDASLLTFEDSTWGSDAWVQGDYGWELTSTGVYSGTYCARSHNWPYGNYGAAYGHGCTSEMYITWTSTVDDSITFYKNVSSESGYDILRFYIDDEAQLELSGIDNDWTRSAYFVPAGTHTFKFAYSKDYSASRGSDCAWIDNIHLPIAGTAYRYVLDTVCEGEDYIFADSTIHTAGLAAGRHSFETVDGAVISILTLVVRERPQTVIDYSGETIRAGETARLDASASNAERYLWNTGETSAIIDVYPTATTTYTITGYNGTCSASASATVNVEGTIGIDIAQSESPEIKLYPNPVSEHVYLESEMAAHVTISDITGRLMNELDINAGTNRLETANWNSGMYIMQVLFQNGVKNVYRIVKK